MKDQTEHISNFTFLKEYDSIFFELASSAEQIFHADPNATLIKLRQLGEALAQDLASRCGIQFDEETTQASLLYKLRREIKLDDSIHNLFHKLRIEGNRATHQFRTKHKEAMDGLKIARSLSVWFHQSFGKSGISFKAGPFVAPKDPSLKLTNLHEQIELLKIKLSDANEQIESNQELAELRTQEKKEYSLLVENMREEVSTFEALASESEAKLIEAREEFKLRLKEMQEQLDSQKGNTAKVTKQTHKASKQFELSEELTRILIDQQLIDAGWEADSQDLTYSKGARPEKGKDKAIAEWPTDGRQHADYVLFSGLTPIAVVEAKKSNANVAGKIPQAERYSRGFKCVPPLIPAWEVAKLKEPWNDGQSNNFKIPFVYSCNGRPYVKQLKEQSGTWFRDVRSSSNTKRALHDFHSPQGLIDILTRDKEKAKKELSEEGLTYLSLRDYQEKAIFAVENALAKGQQNCLLAMATGTGKTRTILGLMYRFLKTERFKRILFLVDRNALGQQALDVFDEAPLEQNQAISKIYNVAELGDMAAEAETRIHVATVQAMVYRTFQSDTPPNIDSYDCVIVDEAHRGYTLDQEMTEGELSVRDAKQYLSSYRRVLDYFDGVKIGMTATPAKHTTDIFGHPVYTYSYREAVADDWLIDHEPPIRYITLLSKNGIQIEQGETVKVINTHTGEVDTADLEDDVNFQVESFNRRVIVPKFNEVICNQLAKEIDPFSNEKTIIFCVKDLHADMVKTYLDNAFKDIYGDSYNEAAVRKITGYSDKVDQLIRRFKNETYPNIAITVDLLTTGIDVPEVCNLVFMRRVRSRILYEQMMGRATRRCDEIGKTVFKIYDPVDIYEALDQVNTMKPLVKNPNISMAQLLDEIVDPASFQALENSERTHADDVLDSISQKVMRIMRKAAKEAENNEKLKKTLDELESSWGIEPDKLHQHLHKMGAEKAAEFIRQHPLLQEQLEDVKLKIGSADYPIISDEEDKLMLREENYGKYKKPEDYLHSFTDFIKNHINESVALSVVVNRPKDLTRPQLKEVRLLLDQHGYTDAKLTTAWRSQTNQEIAASIVGHIRQAALGQELIPFEQRVANGMKKIYNMHQWTNVQRKWLNALAAQFTHEVVIDQEFINQVFATNGGAKNINRFLDQELDTVIETLAESIWTQTG